MDATENLDLNPIEIAEGIDWLGYTNNNVGLHCNPYLIHDGDEAVLIDGGSRDEFSYVMLKILRTGLKPAQIKRLIYHHYDPDLCGSLRSWRRSSTPKSCASSRRWKTMSLSTIIPRRHQSWTIA